jgi:hypothetical protein
MGLPCLLEQLLHSLNTLKVRVNLIKDASLMVKPEEIEACLPV